MARLVSIFEVSGLPFWRRPISLLFIMAVAMPIAFSVWSALLNNFVIQIADFDGSDIGLLHTVREVPGFLAIGVILIIMFLREQTLGLISLALLGVATALTAYFPSVSGLLIITLISSFGFHYFETVNQSLQLQWLPKEKAPQIIGWLVGAGSIATLIVYLGIIIGWQKLELSFNFIYLTSGGLTALIAILCLLFFPTFKTETKQITKLVLRRRYWLYYALQFLSGARRQIFVVFAGFMMVEKFGFEVHQLTALLLINLAINIFVAPLFGHFIAHFGERRALIIEYLGLVFVFVAYGGIYLFDWGVVLAATLFVLDHLFFGLRMALKTYFQKISAPEDIAPTAAVAFTINHIAAVFLPVLLGLLWLISPAIVFMVAALLAFLSFTLALLVPRFPDIGNETLLALKTYSKYKNGE
ncbi:MAG: MFS transporter [Paracoccaceae bacterium]|jgi:MFS family permease|nr:MFS transporter [Paracoccaceae bacterium]